MAASTSRHPHTIPISASPVAPLKHKKSSRKGKGKEHTIAAPKRRVGQVSLVTDSWDTSGVESSWDWKSLTDSSTSKSPPIFTKDGSYFFALVGSSVKIYSAATGQVVSTLSAPHPGGNGTSPDLLTSAVLSPHNPFQLITGSLNGCIMVWDFLDAALLQTIDIAQPIHYMCAHKQFKDSVFVAASRMGNKKNQDDNAVVLQVSLKPSDTPAQPYQKSSEVTPIGKTRAPAGLTFSPSGAWLIAVAGHTAYAAVTSSFKSGFTKYVSPERLTCLAFHPSEEYFATGDDKGSIRLWYCLNDQLAVNAVGVEKKAQTTTLHWHAHAVASIAFTSNGAYLLSGGEESVLVVWQLHTGKKEFVPRLGAPIKAVALSKVGDGEEEYLLGLADATYVFVSASTLKTSRIYSRIKLDPAIPYSSTPTSVPLAIHSLNSTLILPSSHPSSLQTYSPSSSKLISELEVSPSNRVSRRDEKPIEPSRVEQAVIASSGEWMATIDSREGDDTFRGEIYLKIWWWDRKAGYWILNTRIDRPHGLKQVNTIVFTPTVGDRHALQLVTTGEDGNVKSWRIRLAKDKEGASEEFWVTRSTFNFRSKIPTHASWSPDGSLLAISLGPYVALYDPITNALRQALTSPECKMTTSAHFVGRGGRYLAVVGLKDLFLWDLVSQCVQWHYKCPWTIDTIVSHPTEDAFALFHKATPINERQHTRLCVFRASSPVPLRTQSVPFGLRNIAWYSVPGGLSSSSTFSLVGITHTWSVVLVGDDVRLPEEEGSTAREIAADSVPHKRTLFQDIFGKSAFADLSNEPSSSTSRSTTTRPWTGKEVAGIFDGPAYLMPPLESLFEPVMDTFLKTRPEGVNLLATEGNFELEGEDIDMEEDSSDPVVVGTQPRRVVDQEEIDALVDLFKTHTVKSKSPPPLFNFSSNSNGTSKRMANGNAHSSAPPGPSTPKQNGVAPRPKTSIQRQAVVAGMPTPSSTDIPSPLTATVNGKKRKKSLG